MSRLKTIRGKLFICFFTFIVLFNMVVVSIYWSSLKLTEEYHEGFERLLAYNQVSQQANDLYEATRAYLSDRNEERLQDYYEQRTSMKQSISTIHEGAYNVPLHLNTYYHLVQSHVQNSEVAVGFVLRDNVEGYQSLQNLQNTTNFIQEDTLDLIDLQLTDYQDMYQDLARRNEAYIYFTIFLVLSTLCIGGLITLWVANSINRPLMHLTDSAKEVAKGNFTISPVEIRTNDELKVLGNSFNRMLKDLNVFIIEMKEKAEMAQLVKELEFKHLQNQMNPHFLFNTLNTVSKMAYLESAERTSRLIESVSKLMRYNLSHTKSAPSVPLAEEVNVVKSYFHIQRTRFRDRITFKLNLDERLLKQHIPRLTIQPLIENACIHGVEELEEGGEITLNIYSMNEATVIEVIDNGQGIASEKLAYLLEDPFIMNEASGHSTQIGIANVKRRLELFFQQGQLLTIQSKVGEGTKVQIKIPYEKAVPE
ncbi:histidine kinase [Alkalihalobacillus sp. LMS6]|uniref:sensor histidine kinase n=1 Tax=Alkalihalobacillus sp. LMS6 TaxID=2924034 RepID=UPI0020D129C2|nr:histidine kinase [Alkalihalobacillus sp. LMS6]UTR06893.1 histidine kinase [Alkalihalobacillus sp. LMS6]